VATAGGARGTGPERAYCRPLPDAGEVRLETEEERHLVRVRRARPGDSVVLFDGLGRTRVGRLLDRPGGAWVEVEGPYPDREPGRRVEVASAVPGTGRPDDLVFSLAELGVWRWTPLRAQRSDPARLDGLRRGRLERRTREAAKVSGRSRLMEVAPPLSPVEAARSAGDATALVLDPDPAASRLPTLLPPARPVLLLVGPEGGFTEAELSALAREGVRTAALGSCVLRVETAAVAAAAIALATP
jgi:16S rRNA (uracil1498-N3)-methyltransferase